MSPHTCYPCVRSIQLRQKKVTKEKATPSLRPRRFAPGHTCVVSAAGCAVELAFRCARRSDSHGESVHEAWALRRPCHPATAPPQAQPAGVGQPNSQHPFGPLLRSASSRGRKRHALRSLGRAKQWPVGLLGCSAVPPLLAAPAARRLRGGTRVGARVLRALTRRGCPSGARSAKRVPRRTPQPPRRRFAPSQREGVADWGSPFFWVLFFGEAKNKYLARRGESRLPPGTLACSSHRKPRLQQAKTKRSRQDSIATKTIAASAL